VPDSSCYIEIVSTLSEEQSEKPEERKRSAK